MSAAPTTTNDRKRKLPPSFPAHLPEKTVKKLKRDWVNTKVLKAKWRAEKKKDGLLTGANANQPEDEETTQRTWGAPRVSVEEPEPVSEDSEDYEEPELPPPVVVVVAESNTSTKKTDRPIISRPHPLRADRKHKALALATAKGAAAASPQDEEAANLRERTREAYSRSSLHTFKADPLHRRKGGSSGPPAARGRGGIMRGSGGRGDHSNARVHFEPKGQPDMRLRMNAMLDKIKRDFST